MGKSHQISSSSARSSSLSGVRRDSGGGDGNSNSSYDNNTNHNKRTPEHKSVRKSPSSASCGDGDKYELSPNNRAKCNKCKQPILKGTRRIGKESWNGMYRKFTYKYFHEQCASQRLKSQLRFKNQDQSKYNDPIKNLND